MRAHKLAQAQSLADYVVLIAIVSMGLIGMQLYMKRAVQATVKDAADEIGVGDTALESQRAGTFEFDFKNVWMRQDYSVTRNKTESKYTNKQSKGGKMEYGRSDNIRQEGILNYGVYPKEQ